jgi:FSR family fosmidomycin resistance protein-like MFS transporter
VGNGLFPLLPLFASSLGAAPDLIGLYLALVSASITAGALMPGWLPERLSRRGLLIAGSSLGVPALLLLSGATALWQIIPLTCLLWFSGGICIALSSVYTGLLSRAGTRGRTFSLVALSSPCGLLVGGLLVGGLVTGWGYPATFRALAGLWAVLPCTFAVALSDLPAPSRPAQGLVPAQGRIAERWPLLLLAGALLSAASISVSQLGTSFAMQALRFSQAAIASTTTVSGLVMFPIVLLLGVVADRFGRRGLLLAGYLVTACGAVSLGASTALWQFWAAVALLRVGQAVNDAMAPALATDLLPASALGRYLPRLKATNWLAGMLSFAGAGYAMGQLGTGPVFLLAGASAVVGAGLLALLPARRRILLQGEPSV